MQNHSPQMNKKRVIGAETPKKMENYGGWVQEKGSFVPIVPMVERNIVQNHSPQKKEQENVLPVETLAHKQLWNSWDSLVITKMHEPRGA
jgi:hypothetical protein